MPDLRFDKPWGRLMNKVLGNWNTFNHLFGLKLIDTIKHLSASWVDQRTAKEMVERLQQKVELDVALACEEWLDAVVQGLGTKNK